MLWLWSSPPESYVWFSFASAFQCFVAVGSWSLFHLCIRLIFIFSEMLHWWIRNPSGGLKKYVYHGRTKGEGCGHVNRLTPPSNIITDRLNAVLLLWFIILVLFCSCDFQSSIAITSLGEERANFSAFRTFVQFVLVWFYWFPLPLGVWKGLWFVIVALPGLFP